MCSSDLDIEVTRVGDDLLVEGDVHWLEAEASSLGDAVATTRRVDGP